MDLFDTMYSTIDERQLIYADGCLWFHDDFLWHYQYREIRFISYTCKQWC